MADTDTDRTMSMALKMPTFNGDRANFQRYMLQFRAYANAKKFLSVLNQNTLPAGFPRNHLDTMTAVAPVQIAAGADEEGADQELQGTTIDTEKVKLIKANTNAVCAYTLSLTGDQVFNYISGAMTSEWPEGLAYLITNQLYSTFQPSDLISSIEFNARLNAVVFKENDHPNDFFNKLSAIKMEFSTGRQLIPDTKIIPTVVRCVPAMYDQSVQDCIQANGDSTTLDQLSTLMQNKYRFAVTKGAIKEQTGAAQGEAVLVAYGGNDFTCYKCGQKGHKSNDPKCPLFGKQKRGNGNQNQGGGNKRKEKGKGRFRGTCNHCNKRGHKAKDCWEKPENASNRPEGYSAPSRQETGHAAICATEVNFVTTDFKFVTEDVSFSAVVDGTAKKNKKGKHVQGKRAQDRANVKKQERGRKSKPPAAVNPSHRVARRPERGRNYKPPAAISNGTERGCSYKGINNKCTKCCSPSRNTPNKCQMWTKKSECKNSKSRNKPNYKNAREARRPAPDARTAPRNWEYSFAQVHESLNVPSQDYSFVRDLSILQDPNVWVGDTGASCNSTGYDYGMYDIKKATNGEGIMMGNAQRERTIQTGSISGTVCNKYGKELYHAKIDDVSYTPGAAFNLFSIGRKLMQGWNIGRTFRTINGKREATSIYVEKDNFRLNFDIMIRTEKGAIFCAYIKRLPPEVGATSLELAKVTTLKPPKNPKVVMPIQLAHDIFGHNSEARTRQMAYALGIGVSRGTLKPCEACAAGKAKQRNVVKESDHVKAEGTNERVFLDIATIKHPSKLKMKLARPNWRMIVDERTQMRFTDFFATKNGMIEPTCELFHSWRQANIAVTKLRMDNAGENKALLKRANSSDWKLDLEAEYTARYTPQQNNLVEIGLYVIAGKGRAMYYRANCPIYERYRLAPELFRTSTMLDWLTIITLGGISAPKYTHWHPTQKLPRWASCLRTWGEAGVVKTKNLATPRVGDRGIVCMFVGYSDNHDAGVYRMWNQKTGSIMVSRDVIWLKRMFFPDKKPATNLLIGPTFCFGAGEPAGTETTVAANQKVALEAQPLVAEEQATDIPDPDPDVNDVKEAEEDEPEIVASDEPKQVPEQNASDTTTTEAVELELEPRRSRRIAGFEPESDTEEETKQTVQGEVGALGCDWNLSSAEANFYAKMMLASSITPQENEHQWANNLEHGEFDEVAGVGAGVGGGFTNTNELRVMKFKEAINGPDAKHWQKAVDEEYERMVKSGVFKVIPRKELEAGAKVLTSTWAMKKKSNGTYRARLNARGYEQINGEHYDSSSIAAPVTNEFSVRIIMVIALMAGWVSYMCDVKGAFLLGDFEDGEKIHMEIPEGFEKHYQKLRDLLGDIVILLLKTIYGTKQAAMAFWRKLQRAFTEMEFDRSDTDPCLRYKWSATGLVVWLTWVDDLLCFGEKELVRKAAEEMNQAFECDDIGEMSEYVGCKIERKGNESFKFTQPVMCQSFQDEFDLEEAMRRVPRTPSEPNKVLIPGTIEDADQVDPKEHKQYRKGVGKFMHMMRWSRPEVSNSIRELSRSLAFPVSRHLKSMHRAMAYVVSTKEKGWTLRPNRRIIGDLREHEFVIEGQADSDYAKCPVTRRSVSGQTVLLEGTCVHAKSVMQKTQALSVTESELNSGVGTAQDMIYCMRVIESVKLKVKKPMLLRIDNKGAVDSANGWSSGGRMRHVKLNFLRELKEEGVIDIQWMSGKENLADLFTKNLGGSDFEKHASKLIS